MQEATRERMKQLCESIASERDPERFMELVTKLNELLQKNEHEGGLADHQKDAVIGLRLLPIGAQTKSLTHQLTPRVPSLFHTLESTFSSRHRHLERDRPVCPRSTPSGPPKRYSKSEAL